MDQAEIKRRYAGKARVEWERLISTPIRRTEYLITRHCLETYLPGDGLVLDVGGGPGRYAIDLARQGYRVILFDLLLEMLVFGREKASEAGITSGLGLGAGDMISLPFPDNLFDAVLSLGVPLSHLTEADQRRTAVAEMARVAKPGGVLFLTGLNRLAAYRGGVFWLKDPGFFEQVIRPAFRTQGTFLGSQRWYNFEVDELEGLAKQHGLEVLNRVGCEGLANHLPLENLERIEAHPEYWPAWKQILLETCHEPSIIGISNHLLVIARKP